MSVPLAHATVRLPAELKARLKREAARLGLSPSELIRDALEHFFDRDARASQSDLRHHRISEFSQIALDQIIRREHPDLVDVIVTETNKRMERHHGAR